jgi:chaperonin GroES
LNALHKLFEKYKVTYKILYDSDSDRHKWTRSESLALLPLDCQETLDIPNIYVTLLIVRVSTRQARVLNPNKHTGNLTESKTHFNKEILTMSINLKPLGDRLVVEPQEREQTTSSGLVLPETAKEKPQQGEVVAAGPGRRDDDGNRVPLDVAVGDIVLYAKYGGTEVKISGQKYLILKESDVLAIVD